MSLPTSPGSPSDAAGDERPHFFRSVGLELREISGSLVTGHVDVGPAHHTPWGIVHGGLYTTVVETVASVGASTAVQDQGQFAVGLTNSTDFLRSMVEGRLEVVGAPVHQGRTQQLWQVVLSRHDDGKEVARGTVRLQNMTLSGRASTP